MALSHKTIIGSIQTEESGNVGILLKLVVADGATVFSRNNHRFVLDKDGDADATIANVNAHLTSQGMKPVSTADINIIKATADAYWAAIGKAN